ncbi:hypothetical protein BgiMline_020774, partial [Biomphalaria glabrata]|uniref:Uncharacterized protein n=1 Tax=Biomphalaria glabrata TaxID=6526 RepID=A0A2C9LST3_BIOGL
MTRATSLLLFLALITYYQTNALVDPDVKLLVKMMSGLFSTSNDARKEKYTVIEVPGLMAQAGIYYRSYDKYGYKKDIFFLAVSQTNGVISLTYHNITRTFS